MTTRVDLGEKGAGFEPVERAKLTVLVDNTPGPGLEGAWGLSILVETERNVVLFDAGPDPGVLERNVMKLGVDLGRVDFAVLSHNHYDHTGGFSYIARARPGLKIYVPKGSGARFRGLETIEVADTSILAPGVAVVGELYGPPVEEAFAVNVRGKGLVVLVGCSHPGVVNLVRRAKRDLGVKPYLVIGGFHMAGASEDECVETVEELLSLGMEKISPIHCSGDEIRNVMRRRYPENCLEARTGTVINLP